MIGLVTSIIFRNVVEEDEKHYNQPPSWASDPVIKQYFLPRDAFDKTKLQRYQEYMEAERIRLEQNNQLN